MKEVTAVSVLSSGQLEVPSTLCHLAPVATLQEEAENFVLYFNCGNVILQINMCCSPWKQKVPAVQINYFELCLF